MRESAGPSRINDTEETEMEMVKEREGKQRENKSGIAARIFAVLARERIMQFAMRKFPCAFGNF